MSWSYSELSFFLTGYQPRVENPPITEELKRGIYIYFPRSFVQKWKQWPWIEFQFCLSIVFLMLILSTLHTWWLLSDITLYSDNSGSQISVSLQQPEKKVAFFQPRPSMAQVEAKSASSGAYKSMVLFPFSNISFPNIEWSSQFGKTLFMKYVLAWEIDECSLFESGVLNMTSPDLGVPPYYM